MADATYDTSEKAFRRKVEDTLLYPTLAELEPVFRILDALAAKERWYLTQALEIASEMDDLLAAYRGEETFEPTNLSEFRRSDPVTLSESRPVLETSSLLLANSVFVGDISDADTPSPPSEAVVRKGFWEAASRLSARELFLLVEAAKHGPRVPVDLRALQEAMEKVARRHGVNLEGGVRGEEK